MPTNDGAGALARCVWARGGGACSSEITTHTHSHAHTHARAHTHTHPGAAESMVESYRAPPSAPLTWRAADQAQIHDPTQKPPTNICYLVECAQCNPGLIPVRLPEIKWSNWFHIHSFTRSLVPGSGRSSETICGMSLTSMAFGSETIHKHKHKLQTP